MRTEEQRQQSFLVDQALQWCWAARSDADHLLLCLQHESEMDADETWPPPPRPKELGWGRAVWSHHFVSSLAKLIRLLPFLERSGIPGMEGVAKDWSFLTPKQRALRGLIEHSEEYFFDGEKKHPDQWAAELENGQIEIDASSMIIVDGRPFIGGRLDVLGALREVSLLEARLVEAADRLA